MRCVPVLALLAAFVLAGIASARDHGSAASGQTRTITLQLKAVDSIKYNKKKLAAKAGKVKIVMKNASPLQHDVAIAGHGVHAKGKLVNIGGTSTVVATLKPGVYTFYCTVPGHAAAGMKGTLVVN